MGKIADILQARGELDEALRLLRDEVLAIFERLGDVRSKAVTMGQIADILQARGELDEALVLQEQRLPIARRLDDIDSLAHVLYSRASIRLQRRDHERGGLQEIYEDLAEAFEFSCKLGRPDFISGVGWLLAQVLTLGGLRDEALSVLDAVEAAWRKLGNAQGLAEVAELRARIGAAD
jgi:tetratricopeptide (TPR) repeat protein